MVILATLLARFRFHGGAGRRPDPGDDPDASARGRASGWRSSGSDAARVPVSRSRDPRPVGAISVSSNRWSGVDGPRFFFSGAGAHGVLQRGAALQEAAGNRVSSRTRSVEGAMARTSCAAGPFFIKMAIWPNILAAGRGASLAGGFPVRTAPEAMKNTLRDGGFPFCG